MARTSLVIKVGSNKIQLKSRGDLPVIDYPYFIVYTTSKDVGRTGDYADPFFSKGKKRPNPIYRLEVLMKKLASQENRNLVAYGRKTPWRKR